MREKKKNRSRGWYRTHDAATVHTVVLLFCCDGVGDQEAMSSTTRLLFLPFFFITFLPNHRCFFSLLVIHSFINKQRPSSFVPTIQIHHQAYCCEIIRSIISSIICLLPFGDNSSLLSTIGRCVTWRDGGCAVERSRRRRSRRSRVLFLPEDNCC